MTSLEIEALDVVAVSQAGADAVEDVDFPLVAVVAFEVEELAEVADDVAVGADVEAGLEEVDGWFEFALVGEGDGRRDF